MTFDQARLPGVAPKSGQLTMVSNFDAFRQRYQAKALICIAATGLLSGGGLWWSGHAVQAGWAWSVATAPVLFGLFFQITVSLRMGDVGLDIVAALSMSAALVFGEPLAANVVAMMYASGQLLEDFAQGRAKKEMTALLGRVAQTAMRFEGDVLKEVPIAAIKPGDRILIRQGDVLPVDGRVASAVAVLDLSALTGESLTQKVVKGSEALSGSSSAGSPFELVASRPAAESVVAGLGLSLGAMIAASFGYLPPVEGALLQEVIDVAVILNALRALR